MKRTPWPEGENERMRELGKGRERRFRALSEVRFISFILPRFLNPKIPACTVYYITSLIKPKPEPEMEPGWGAAAFSEKRMHLLPCGRV